jgi:hypothetical protein
MLEIPGMAITIGPTRLSFPNRRLVALDAPTEDGQLFHGSLGRDVYRLHDQLTINYRTMRVALGGP